MMLAGVAALALSTTLVGAPCAATPDARSVQWIAGLAWTERTERVALEGHAVDLDILVRPDHARQIDRVAAGARRALVQASRWPAPYPYSKLTIVELPWRSPQPPTSTPGLVAIDVPWLEPALATDVETALARGIARQLPIAEVFSAYAAGRLLDVLVERQLDTTDPNGFMTVRFFGGFIPHVIRGVRANAIERDRFARALETFEREVGGPAVEAALAGAAGRAPCGHPALDAFEKLLESASGRHLRRLFDETLHSEATFDYAVDRVATEAITPGGPYRSTIVIARRGTGSVRAVDVHLSFADGSSRSEQCNGGSRSATLVYESAAPLESVVVDPDRVVSLDAALTNNSWTRVPRSSTAATRWSARWTTWLADLLLEYAFFV